MCGHSFLRSRLRELRFASLTSHQIAVCTGNQVSPSKFNVLVSDKQQGCPWCGSWDADWHHVSWGCSRAPRPQQLTLDSCCDVLQSRLGWPSRLGHGRASILRFLNGWRRLANAVLTAGGLSKAGHFGCLCSESPGPGPDSLRSLQTAGSHVATRAKGGCCHPLM